MIRKKRVLITGGAGFIGSHLSELFLRKGYEVICMDNLITGSIKNIESFKGDKSFKFIKHDVTRYIGIKGKIDYVLHFASPASPIDYLRYPIQTLKVGSLGTHNALGFAMAKNAAFLLASTSEIYGDPLVNPQPESYWGHVNPIGPRGVYDEAKRFAEAITMAYHRVHKVDIRIARIFNTYGQRMRGADGRAIPNFINQALKGNPLTIYGTGSQTRSFCYIDDLTRGIYMLLMSKETNPVNIGNSNEISLLKLAKTILKLTDSNSRVAYLPLPADDPKVRCPNITKAIRVLKWKPHTNLEKGLLKTIAYFQKSDIR